MFQIRFGSKDYSKYSDEELLSLTKKGEKIAFEYLYDKRSNKIYNFLLTKLNYNEEDASTTLSEVFIKIYEYNKNKKIDKFQSFVYQVARNKAIDLIKTNNSENKSDFDDNIIENIYDESDINQKKILSLEFKQELLRKFISQLDEIQKDVLHMYFFDDKSYDEIAEIIGSNKNSVGTLIFKAKKNLKSIVTRAGFEKILLEG